MPPIAVGATQLLVEVAGTADQEEEASVLELDHWFSSKHYVLWTKAWDIFLLQYLGGSQDENNKGRGMPESSPKDIDCILGHIITCRGSSPFLLPH